MVYGGGGIIPDVFVPKETDYEKESIDYALRSGFMSRYVFNLLERDRKYYNTLNLAKFKEEVEISDADISDFVSYAARREIKITAKAYKEELKRSIKAVMAQQLFGTTLYEQMINNDDAMVKKLFPQ